MHTHTDTSSAPGSIVRHHTRQLHDPTRTVNNGHFEPDQSSISSQSSVNAAAQCRGINVPTAQRDHNTASEGHSSSCALGSTLTAHWSSLLSLQLLSEVAREAGSQPSSPCPLHHRLLQLQQTQDGHSNVILTAQDSSKDCIVLDCHSSSTHVYLRMQNTHTHTPDHSCLVDELLCCSKGKVPWL